MTIRTILVDDEPLAIQGLRVRLEKHEDVEVVDTCSNGREAMARFPAAAPQVVLTSELRDGLHDCMFVITHGHPAALLVRGIAQVALGERAISFKRSVGSAIMRSWMSTIASGRRARKNSSADSAGRGTSTKTTRCALKSRIRGVRRWRQ